MNDNLNSVNSEALSEENVQEAAAEAVEETAAEVTESAEVVKEEVKESEKIVGEEAVPVFVPDDYDPEAVNYDEVNTIKGVVSAKEDITEQPKYQKQKLRGKAAIENFFYHHKTTLIVCLITALALGFVIYQSIPVKYDYTFMIYAHLNMGMGALDEVTEQLTEYCEDVDGDGEVKLNVLLYDRESNDYNMQMAAYVFLQTDLTDEYSSFLLITDKSTYEFIEEMWEPEIFEAYKDYPVHISLKNTDLITSVAKDYGNDTELFISLLSMPEDKKDDKELIERKKNAEILLERIIEENPQIVSAE